MVNGGLINILSYGADDLFLTGAPQITLFKMIYRRYTNFAKESVIIPLDNIDFGKKISINVPKIGDLISNTYIQLNIPSIHLLKIDTVADITNDEYEILNTPYPIATQINQPDYAIDYDLTKSFMNVNITGYRKAVTNSTLKNETVIQYINSILNEIQSAITEPNIINNYKLTLEKAFNYELENNNVENVSILNYKLSDISFILNDLLIKIDESNLTTYGYTDTSAFTISDVLTIIERAVNVCKKVMNYYFINDKYVKEQQLEAASKYAKFAWISKIGLAMIDYVEIQIGGETIDKHYGDFMNIWQELTNLKYNKELYDKIIGNVRELTTFDRNEKSQYTLYVPLMFWFCKKNGLAFPLVALEFNNFQINIKFKRLEDCAYVEKLPSVDQIGTPINLVDNALSLSDIWSKKKLCINWKFVNRLCIFRIT